MKTLQKLLGYLYPNKCMLCRHIVTTIDDPYICRLCYHHFRDSQQDYHYHLTGEKRKVSMSFMPFAESKYFVQPQLEMKDKGEADFNLLQYMSYPIISLFPYDTACRKAILRWKYRGFRKYAKGFAKLLVEERLGTEHEQTVLIPIPLAPSRMKKRGYNQALDLAIEIGKITKIPVWDYLKRTHDTKPQASCGREERYKNVQNSMDWIAEKKDIKVNSILLIDDIYTTGSTIKEAIRVIKRQYIFRNTFIYVVVVGKGSL